MKTSGVLTLYKQTRMTTFIISEALWNYIKDIEAISQLGAEKITFPPKSDIQTDINTYIHTDGH